MYRNKNIPGFLRGCLVFAIKNEILGTDLLLSCSYHPPPPPVDGFGEAQVSAEEIGCNLNKISPAPTYSCLTATIGAEVLNCRVRDGNGCTHFARDTGNIVFKYKFSG